MSESTVTITVDEEKKKRSCQGETSLMTESTVDGASNDTNEFGVPKSDIAGPSRADTSRNVTSNEIETLLIIHEKKSGAVPGIPADDSSSSDSEDEKEAYNFCSRPFKTVEEMEDDDDDEGPMVSIGGAKVSIHDVTDDMVAKMTPQEKEEYIRLGQEMYQDINQIDHILVNNKWRRSLRDVRVLRGADVNSDHYLLKATIKLKLRKAPIENQNRKRLDTARLKSPNVKKAFCLELKNRFSVLDNSDDGEDSVQEKWDNIKDIYVKTAEKTVGHKTKKNKDWLTSETWQKNEERKTIKQKSVNAKSKRLQDQLQVTYRAKDKEVKRSARKDKRQYLEDLAKKQKRQPFWES
ncbi:unnamed protein product [Mytilus edulis]|uniref:Transcription factor TFIIE alpha subunit C-terminal domain-containing protein n=1 Tax=Mytilus edulis TaxID=6550 RepID=A0A8S3PXQ5_MYTED|nr:unnamed protein product [Mytilus edulis]